MRRPWFKFYPSDWRGDAKLQGCTLAARGLWIDILCLMHEATPYGHLLIEGKPPTYYRIAQLVGADYRLVQKLMTELKNADVFASNPASEIASRRMVRDHSKSQLGRAFSERRWGVIPNAPESRKKERGPTKESKAIKQANGQAKAQHTMLHVLSSQLGIGYAEALDMLAAHPKLCDRATRAEMRKPGEGVQVAVVGLHKIMRGSAP